MAELINTEDTLSRLLPPAMPLIGAETAVATIALWTMLGRRQSALLPILTTPAQICCDLEASG